jgi:hypothetical protein
MKKSLPVLLLLVLSFSFPGADAFAAGAPTGLEGEYVEEGGTLTLTITADHWKTKSGDIEEDELYTAKKTGENSYQITYTFTEESLKGQTTTATARKEGNFLFTKMQDSKIEVKWKKK